jgi:hypothetical protein
MNGVREDGQDIKQKFKQKYLDGEPVLHYLPSHRVRHGGYREFALCRNFPRAGAEKTGHIFTVALYFCIEAPELSQ